MQSRLTDARRGVDGVAANLEKTEVRGVTYLTDRTEEDGRSVAEAAERYGRFLELPVVLA